MKKGMKKRSLALFMALAMVISLLSGIVPAQMALAATDEKIVVVLDPGHGGSQPGAQVKDANQNVVLNEKDINLKVASYAKAALEADERFEVYLTREDDATMDLMSRAKIADSKNADVFVSIHFNAAASPSNETKGSEVWQSVLPEYQIKGLPEMFLQKLHENVGLNIQRGVKQRASGDRTCWNYDKNWDTSVDTGTLADYYGVIKSSAKMGIPGMIVEHAFMDNAEDFACMSSEENLKKMGEADAEALIEFYTGHEHSYGEVSRDYPVSCVTTGKQSEHCSICKARRNITAIADEVDADAHFYKPGEVTKEATFFEEGEKKCECAYDGNEHTVPIEKKDITVYHTNDIHGNCSSGVGIDKVAALKKNTEDSLLLDAGDATQGVALATLTKGENIIELMNLAGCDAMAAGNHEFDYGQEQLLKNLSLADFPILAANAIKNGNPLLAAAYGEDKLSNGENIIISKAGAKVGIFGLVTTETKTAAHPSGTKGITFEDEIETAKAQIDSLEEQGAEVILCLAHLGDDESVDCTSEQLAEGLDGAYAGKLDAIIDGHSHTVENKKVNGIHISQTGTALAGVGEVTISEDNGEIAVSSKVLTKEDLAEVTADATVSARLNEMLAEQEGTLKVRVADTANALWGGTINNVTEGRMTETNLGNLIADSMVDSGKELIKEGNVDDQYLNLPIVAIENGGGIRQTISNGTITKGDIINVLPFGNVISFKAVTPKVLYDVMELGVSYITGQDAETGILSGGASGGFLQIGGMRMVYRPGNATGQKVTEIYLDGEETPLSKTDETRKIILASNDYLIAGGNDYTMLAGLDTVLEGDVLDVMLENKILKLTKNGTVPLTMPITENRIVAKSGYVAKDYIAHIRVVKEDGSSAAGETVTYYVDNGLAQSGKVNTEGLLDIQVTDGPHAVKLAAAQKEVYICNYTGSGVVTTFTGKYPELVMPQVKKEEEQKKPVAVTKYQVTFKNGKSVSQISVEQGKKVAQPTTPVKRGYTFLGWYAGTQKYDFNKTLSANLTLTAKWKKVTVKKAALKKLKWSKKKVTVKLKKVSGAAGYQIKFGTNKKVTKKTKKFNVKSAKQFTKKWTKKTCYVKIRAYKLDSAGKKVYGKWSKVKQVKK